MEKRKPTRETGGFFATKGDVVSKNTEQEFPVVSVRVDRKTFDKLNALAKQDAGSSRGVIVRKAIYQYVHMKNVAVPNEPRNPLTCPIRHPHVDCLLQ